MSLELLKKRLNYWGGNQQQRMIKDKLRGQRKAQLYSYQAATAILSNGKEFRCLINPDKNKPAYDNKIISIPYEDICLNTPRVGKTTQGKVSTEVNPGDVFIWKETNTHWLIWLQFIEEYAYFRSEIRRCDQQVKVNDTSYWVYIRGPVETSIEWNQKKKVEWNNLNYSLVMYITADENTNLYFERFKTIKVLDPRLNIEKNWQIVGVDPYYGDGILQVFLDEFFENSIADAVAVENANKEQSFIDKTTAYIDGPIEVKQYSKAYYQINNIEGGQWFVEWNNEEHDLNNSLNIISLQVPGELKPFKLIYRTQDRDVNLNIKIIPI